MEKCMEVNLSGVWTGELRGTNPGGMTLDIQHDGDRLYGRGRFYEPSHGSYEYTIQGIVKDEVVSFFLTPKANQALLLGNIQASGKINDPNSLSGQWASTIGTEGVFVAKRSLLDDQANQEPKINSVFLIHGHDEGTKEKVARFLEKLDIDVIILHEQVNKGMTVIEKFEEYAARAGFAVALFTPDDIGSPLASEDKKQPRARQNVVLEMGYFVGRLGRDKVCVLYKGAVELPSDILGVVYSQIEDSDGWKLTLAKELKAAGYPIDMNKIVC
jgi:predicted nucleotide-binding protein